MTYYFFFPLLVATSVHFIFVFSVVFVKAVFDRHLVRPKFFSLFPEYLKYSLPFLVLSFVIGFLSGVSQQPTLSALVPAVMSFFGGAIAFIYVNDSKKLDLMAVVMISFSVTLVYSMKAGATIREIERENNIFHLIDLEKRIDNRRNALGLEKSQPAWLYEQEKH